MNDKNENQQPTFPTPDLGVVGANTVFATNRVLIQQSEFFGTCMNALQQKVQELEAKNRILEAKIAAFESAKDREAKPHPENGVPHKSARS